MQDRLNIPPTKSSLLDLKRRLEFLNEGYRLLERKRELLTRLVYEKLAEYRTLNETARESMKRAYRWLAVTQMRMGSKRIQQLAIGMPEAFEARVLPRRNMSVQYPSVQIRQLPLLPVGILGTDASLDETRASFSEMVVKAAQLAEAETALWRLLEEQRKTQKRVNALRYNVIPRFERTISYVEATLEEEERNTLFQLKVLAQRG
ncbi:MAG: V-type ATP synthase subunit D [Gammaproteobacteria bacterium]|nr:MAG: V-type ATP synthase subunit D [Gammaproteobacteria bacterium]UCH39921.1 MAG: V-type ATP synthase subunit D [Gammaproteobacteria bacterium]